MATNTIEPGSVLLFMVAILLYLVGLNFHTKIIKISKKEKDASTWKIDISNSLLLIILHSLTLAMHGITYITPNLYKYTGEWVCYTYKALALYARVYHIGNSLVVCIMKYIIIVQWERVRIFGEEKMKEIFFWLNILHPLVTLAVYGMVRPDFLMVFTGVTPSNLCLGETYIDKLERNKTLSVPNITGICGLITKPEDNSVFYYTVFVGRKIFCRVQNLAVYLMAFNIFEVFFYYKIFSFANR